MCIHINGTVDVRIKFACLCSMSNYVVMRVKFMVYVTVVSSGN